MDAKNQLKPDDNGKTADGIDMTQGSTSSSEQAHEENGVEIPLSLFMTKEEENDMGEANLGSSDRTQDGRTNRSRGLRYAIVLSVFALVLAVIGTGVGVGLREKEKGTIQVVSAINDNEGTAANQSDENHKTKLDITGEIEELFNVEENLSQIDDTINATDNEGDSYNKSIAILVQYAAFDSSESQSPTSYQSKAAEWVGTTSTVELHTTQRILQRYALACLYFATNGVQTIWSDETFGFGVVRPWVEETGWLEFEDECSWYKVDCNEKGEVTSISLFANRLSGAIPPELALLKSSLESIDVFDNPIYNSGDAGHDWLGELTNLKHLNYGRTYFEYNGIPTIIGNLTKLEQYDCSYTLYNGPLRGEIFVSTLNLTYLDIAGNNFNSSIPSELATLPNLEYMYAEDAGLTGDLSFITEMPVIGEIWMDRNYKMRGSIPVAIGKVTSLQFLSINHVGLTGTLPTELGLLPLRELWAYSNGGLRGTIPSELGKLDSLLQMSLVKTSLRGTMPDEICANAFPNGDLSVLEADCQEEGRVVCSCCSCCGSACIIPMPAT